MLPPATVAQGFNQQRKGGRLLPAAGIIEVKAGKGRAPIRQDAHKAAFAHMRQHAILGNKSQSETIQRGLQAQAAIVESQLAFDAHFQFAPVFLKLPGIKAAAGGEAQIDAVMGGQVLRRAGFFAPLEVTGLPTTAMRISGAIGTAIMSRATCSPSRTPAS